VIKILTGNDVRENLPFFIDHFSQMTSDDIYCRFFHSIRPDALREWLITLNEDHETRHHFFVSEEPSGEYSSIVQLSINSHTSSAEVSVSVLPQYQKRGLASMGLDAAISFSRDIGLHSLHFTCMLGNQKCRKLFALKGFTGAYDPDMDGFAGSLTL
jgi:RimJ/RimL family protein N-acetyltransferase